MKLEDEKENTKRVIDLLDERAGPALIGGDSISESSASISPVQHEVEQVDSNFAQSFRFTTDVSL